MSSGRCLFLLLSLFCVWFYCAVSIAHAQQAPSSVPRPAGGSWKNVEALPPNTKLHVTTDHGGKTCRIFSVTDDALTCAAGGHAAGTVLQRSEIRHIKLTHRVRSTLLGAGIAGGVGAIAGGIAGKAPACPPTGFCLNIIDGKTVALVFGVGSAVVGSIVGGATDFARGSSIYTRP